MQPLDNSAIGAIKIYYLLLTVDKLRADDNDEDKSVFLEY
jgi:hypothetical protein